MRKHEKLSLLLQLAELGALKKEIHVSTRKIAEKIGISRQSVHRKLMELEREKLITRKLTSKGQLIKITSDGEDFLRSIYHKLEILLGEIGVITLEGRVFTGIGEGAYYVSHPKYEEQFIEKFGFKPYPGTLNIRLVSESVKKRRKLELMRGIIIEGFSNKGRSYGNVKGFKAIINGAIRGGVLLVERTHYGPDVLEIIAPYYLRDRLNLKDGDLIRVDVVI